MQKDARKGVKGVSNGKVLIKCNYQLIPVDLKKILFMEALSDYVIIKTTDEKYITLSTMKDMINNLPDKIFARSHRSYIVNLDRISSVKGEIITVYDDVRNEHTVKIGRAYKQNFKTALYAI